MCEIYRVATKGHLIHRRMSCVVRVNVVAFEELGLITAQEV